MITIKSAQQDVFKQTALKKFEDEMVEHVKDFFPVHYNSMQEKNVRTLVQHGYANARKYDVISVRNVCLYLNSMLLLGSNFDEDPQYPWAKEILTDKSERDTNLKMDKIADQMLEMFRKITGTGNIIIYRVILTFTKNPDGLFKKLSEDNLSKVLYHLNNLFKQKYEAVGEDSLNEMIKLGTANARRYGIKDEGYILVYIVFMFMLGSGFDHDPQFPWIAEILNNTALKDEQKKTEILYNTSIAHLQKVLAENTI